MLKIIARRRRRKLEERRRNLGVSCKWHLPYLCTVT
jgi:hypothetical protein